MKLRFALTASLVLSSLLAAPLVNADMISSLIAAASPTPASGGTSGSLPLRASGTGDSRGEANINLLSDEASKEAAYCNGRGATWSAGSFESDTTGRWYGYANGTCN